ncbi:uncharacterized protein LOC130695531 [Daphnia carinata]|uniref:uncharacterized protein LOC130695531 n=1 Tax=Daphnia carinata TaxID=120202 RepID=UPI00257E30F9|nr:uncharacterized protein LOC130695531 [Daphnia carinata]
MLMLLLLSIDSVTCRPLPTDDWQRSAGTNGIVPNDTLLPCVESADCVGRVFGSHSEDVSKFGNVPPCISYGWVRCIQHAGPVIDDSAHGQLAPPPKLHYYPKEKHTPIVEPYGTHSQVSPRQDHVKYKTSNRPAQEEHSIEPARYAAVNNQRIEWHNWGLQPNEAGRKQERQFVGAESLAIPAEKRARFNMGVFQFHQTSPPPLVNKQTVENIRGNQPSQWHESPELGGPTERPVEFHHGQQRFEQSPEQLMKAAKFGQQKKEEHGVRTGQNQLTHTVGYEFLDNNLAERQPSRQHNKPEQPVRQFADEREQKRIERPFEHHPQSGQREIADAIQRFIKVAPKPVEVHLREESNGLFQVTPRAEPIQPGERLMSSRPFVELPDVQRKLNEPSQGFDRVSQQLVEPAQQKQSVRRPDMERQGLSQATQRPLEFQSPAKPIVQQPMSFENVQQRPSAKPLHFVKETVVWVTGPPRLPQTTARPSPVERLEQPAAKSSSLIASPEFIEPAKSSLESLLIRFNSAKDTQQADEQLTALLKFFAMPANQPASPDEALTDSSDAAPPFTGKHESNVVPFIAFSEPLPLEPASNALF